MKSSTRKTLEIYAKMLRDVFGKDAPGDLNEFCKSHNIPTPLELDGHAATIERLLEEDVNQK